MTPGKYPELLDRLAARHAMGQMSAPTRRRFEYYASQSAAVRTAALLWRERLAAMTELARPVEPATDLWPRIRARIESATAAGAQAADGRAADRSPGLGAALRSGAESAARSADETLRRMLDKTRQSLGYWRAGAVAASALLVLASVVGHTQWRSATQRAEQLQVALTQGEANSARLQAENARMIEANERLLREVQARPQLQYVAVLADDRAGANLVVAFDARNRVIGVQRTSGYREAADKSLQLWAIGPSGSPRSLGVLGSQPNERLNVRDDAIAGATVLAISLEPQGGVSGERGPTGPVLFKGALLPAAL